MDNNYKFVDENSDVIYKVISQNRVIPEKGQRVIVRNKKYLVFRVCETIDFDRFAREITIYITDLL